MMLEIGKANIDKFGNGYAIIKLVTVLFACLVRFSACAQEKTNVNERSFILKEEWAKDTLGCLGKRQIIVTDSLNVIRKFKGVKVEVFVENFGKPNFTKQTINSKILMYWVTCGRTPKPKNPKNTYNTGQVNKEATQLLVEVSTENVVQKIRVVVP